jgi:hypothetical protein
MSDVSCKFTRKLKNLHENLFQCIFYNELRFEEYYAYKDIWKSLTSVNASNVPLIHVSKVQIYERLQYNLV